MSAAGGPSFGAPKLTANGVFFWLLKNPVAIRYSFFLVAVIMAGQRPVGFLPGWLIVVTFAVLLHELGHAAVARLFGQDPAIELYAMGGATTWQWRGAPRWHQRALVALAGPLIGFVAAAAVCAGMRASSARGVLPHALLVALDDFLFVTIAWGVFNLLPILPLDGGGVMEAVLSSRLDAGRARWLARVLSCACGVLCALLALLMSQPYAAILCALFAWSNFQRLGSG